jgi:hypothetical protein
VARHHEKLPERRHIDGRGPGCPVCHQAIR